MSLVVTNNISAINANRNLARSNSTLNSSLEKLSSGYRINTGKDGPADLVISEQLRAQLNGLERAVRNTNEAMNVISIAEGALNEMNEILKSMKALAIHAANNGITSPEQIEADQAEMDSAIQTLERIANTTKYSDQMLLNGSKDITYDRYTEVKGTQNNNLVDASSTYFQQIYKRDGYAVTIGFNGSANADTNGIGDADMTKQAAKAYLEIDTIADSLSQVDEEGNLTQTQTFILTGSLGSRQFSFGAGTNITEVVSAISNYADSTGVDASLTFNSAQTINYANESQSNAVSIGGSGTDSTVTEARAADDITVYDNFKTDDNGDIVHIVNGVSAANFDPTFGLNTDGQGRIYIKVTGEGQFELYKDASLSAESLIGLGTNAGIMEMNNSDLSGLTISISTDASYGDVAYISVGNIRLDDDNATGSGIMTAPTGTGVTVPWFDMDESVASGVQLGINTDDAGTIHTKVVIDDDGQAQVFAYSDASMKDEFLVAMSEKFDSAATNGNAVILNQVWNEEKTASSGLAMHLNFGGDWDGVNAGTYTGSITFDNLGARVYTTEYGSDAMLQVQMLEGGLFTYYDQQNNASSNKLVESGVTYRNYGQDATVNVNGKAVKTNGLTLSLSTSDIMAKMVFNSGHTGTTTIAQVGYGEGSIFSKNTSLTFDLWDTTNYGTNENQYFSALLNNACHVTKETLNHFDGGMQLQLGEGSGDQERTVVAIRSMAIDNLGRTSVTGKFGSNGVYETKTLSVRDLMNGGLASLGEDAVLAMKVIEQAITDVTEARAQLGAIQANMLQTNANNLEVAIENLTLTESAIRDTDMASEMTNYTSSQVLANAGISMLAQANTQAQNVLSLLR